MSTAQFTTPLIVVIPGQLITASLWNNEFINFFTNLNPQGIGAYSDNDAQMRTSTDPFPGGATSRPTAISGELERIRYILNLIIGKTYWYQHPSTDLETINTTPIIPSGTIMPFYQATAPVGWTQVTTQNDKALRVVSGVGGGVGGTTPFSNGITLAHSHTVASHTHDLANHTHTTPNHVHTLDADTVLLSPGSSFLTDDGSGHLISATASGSSGSKYKTSTTSGGSGTSGTPSSNTSGAATPGTDSKLTDFSGYQYIDLILASKD